MSIIVLAHAGPRAPISESDANEEAAVQLQQALKAVPLYPGATPFLTREMTPDTFYWAGDAPGKVMEFYLQRLRSENWMVEQLPTARVGGAKDDGTTLSGIEASFNKGGIRLRIDAVTNYKDPERGATRLHISVERK